METGLTMKNKICVVSCLPALDNKFYSRALEIQRMSDTSCDLVTLAVTR